MISCFENSLFHRNTYISFFKRLICHRGTPIRQSLTIKLYSAVGRFKKKQIKKTISKSIITLCFEIKCIRTIVIAKNVTREFVMEHNSLSKTQNAFRLRNIQIWYLRYRVRFLAGLSADQGRGIVFFRTFYLWSGSSVSYDCRLVCSVVSQNIDAIRCVIFRQEQRRHNEVFLT